MKKYFGPKKNQNQKTKNKKTKKQNKKQNGKVGLSIQKG
jgi:hypothetical protein